MFINDQEKKIKQKIQEISGKTIDIDKKTCYDLVRNYREYRIKKILILSSTFNFFLLEEEGRLNNLFTEWYNFSDEQPPTITHVETGKDVIKKIKDENYDLIIIFNKPKDGKINVVTNSIKERTDAPIVILYNDLKELLGLINDKKVHADKFFTWNGDGKILLSIVQYFEDKKNLEISSYEDIGNIIFLIEDSIQHISSYFSLINEEIRKYLNKILEDNLNCEQKALRYKRRPFVVHASDYKQAIDLFEKFKDKFLLIITDNYLEANGGKKQIGLKLANIAAESTVDLPILIQSSEPIQKDKISNKKIAVISKNSHALLSKLSIFIKDNLGPHEILIKDKKGKEKLKIKNIYNLQENLSILTDKQLLNSANNKDFSKLFRSFGEVELANRCLKFENSIVDGKTIRQQMIDLFEDYNYSVNQSAITSFSRKINDPLVKITRIGDGALGGKARGLAFLAKIISKYIDEDMFSNLRITIPRSIVLSTEIFDIFMSHNNLSDFDFYNLSDDRISTKFINASLPAIVLGDLRAFIQNTRKPLIVRSSGLLEDSLMQPFAGIYASMLLPNDSWETDLRFQEVCNAIKHVYASTYFEKAQMYIKNTPKHIGDEKMAVLIQEIVGEKNEKYFYPTISGVAKSYNYYPSGPCKQEEGIVYLALGLGKSIVDGGSSYAFCPEKPKAPLFGTPKDYMKYAQTKFYALNLRSIYKYVNYNEDTSLDKLEIDIAKKHGNVEKIASTYIPQDDSLYPGLYENGNTVIDFGPIINYDSYPLAKAIKLLLKISEIALGYPVEIEFAVNIPKKETEKAELVILQIRNMVPPDKNIDIKIQDIPSEKTIIKSNNALGHGVIDKISNIVYIDQDKFDLSNSNQVVNQIRQINKELIDKKTPYVLIGPGRWGSSDPWLGIPVVWSDIAGAKTIIETPYRERPIDPSQGSHFFHDMIASQVVYLITKKQEDIKWEWIKKQKTIKQTEFIKHIKTQKPLKVMVDGKEGKGVIIQK